MPIVIPILFWSVYHYHKDRHLPEPIGHLLLALGLYDFIVLMNSLYALPLAALLILAIWIWRLKLMRDMHEKASQG